MRILFITSGSPYPPNSGVKIHDFHIIKHISHYHSVLLLSLLEFPEEIINLQELKQYCEFVDFISPNRRSVWEHLKGIGECFASGRPLATHGYFYKEMAAKIRKVLSEWDVDIVQIEHSFLAPYIEFLPADSRCKKVLSFHNIGFNQYRRMLYLETGTKEKILFLLKWILMLGWEAKYAERFDHCLTVSSVERDLLRSVNQNLPVSIIRNGVDTELHKPLTNTVDDNTLLFAGMMGYPPNADAVLYFCKHIMPIIRRSIENIKLIVVGHYPGAEIRKLARHGNIVVTGSVHDVTPYYRQSQVTVVPLRAGGGTRLKILESMALGRPVVSTSIGCEGLNVIDGENIMIADTPSDFAERVVSLLTNEEFRTRISQNARQLVENEYDWAIISQKLLTIYDKIAGKSKG